jgi:hypothetical protein
MLLQPRGKDLGFRVLAEAFRPVLPNEREQLGLVLPPAIVLVLARVIQRIQAVHGLLRRVDILKAQETALLRGIATLDPRGDVQVMIRRPVARRRQHIGDITRLCVELPGNLLDRSPFGVEDYRHRLFGHTSHRHTFLQEYS